MASAPEYKPGTVAHIQQTLTKARAGDVPGALALAQSGLLLGEATEVFRGLLGMLECQSGNLESGIAHFRAALKIKPSDIAVRSNLIRALTDKGDLDAALAECPESLAQADQSLRLLRLRSWLLQETGDHVGAAAAYRQIVAAHPDDFESWNNLGNALSGESPSEEGLEAVRKAASLQPGNAPVRFNLASTLLQLEKVEEAEAVLKACCADFPADEKPRVELAAMCKSLGRDGEALSLLEEAAKLQPRDADIQVKLGLEQQFAWRMAEAEVSFRRATQLAPAHGEAHILLALQLEHMNKPELFGDVIASAVKGGVDAGALHFIHAMACRRDGKFEQGLAELDQVPDDIEPVRVAQLRGQFLDRLGRPKESFAAFAEMNRLHKDDPSEPVRRAQEYRDALERDRALVTPEWYASWDDVALDGRAAPVFLLGFPRSGTTLLDTMLMGHPSVQVLEERPLISRVEAELGGLDRLPHLTSKDVSRLRDVYFDEARQWIDLRSDSVLIDKFPLHLNKVPIMHRLFPDARYIVARRHPMDVLLSCYITNFRLNNAMANFLDLETAAWVYDQSFGFWEQAASIMNVRQHIVTYERMVEDSATELQPLFDWLGLDWREDVLDHQQTASNRGVITTASYAQVTEPIYTRAKGRWEKYRDQLAPILPDIAPWARRYGYEV